jgi:hypothetical protein
MRLWIAALMIGASALTLSACHKKEAANAPAASAPATGAAAKKAPVPTPQRKPGLWKQTMSMEGLPFSQTVTLCLDAQSDKQVAWWAQQGARSGCAKNDVAQQADGSWKFSSVCELAGGVKMQSEGTASGDFSSKYRLTATTTTSGAKNEQFNGSHTVNIDAEWTGPCPAGMKGGDMQLPNGQIVNTLQMAPHNAGQDTQP